LGVTIGAIPAVEGVPVSKMAADTGALAAINGDFYAGNYFPQGITVIEGQVVTAPKLRSAFGFSHEREPFIGYFTMGWTWPAYVVAENGEVIPLQLMNVPCDPQWLCMYTHHRANRLPEGFGGVRVLMDENFEVVEIIQDKGIDIPDGYSALLGGQSTGDWLLANVEVGDMLEIVRPTDPPWENFQSVISGGPRLMKKFTWIVTPKRSRAKFAKSSILNFVMATMASRAYPVARWAITKRAWSISSW
jgi:hypothetical protein